MVKKGLSDNVRARLKADQGQLERAQTTMLELDYQLQRSQLEMNRHMAAMDMWSRGGMPAFEKLQAAVRANPLVPPKPEPEKPFPTHHEDGKRIGWLAEIGFEAERGWI